MVMIYISVGSNLGDRLGYIQKALKLLKNRYMPNLKCSIIIETEAITMPKAPLEWSKPFLNAVVFGDTELSPQELLRGIKEIEHEIGRPINHEKWSPRVIDLDILLWEGVEINSPELTIPHPELCNRPFLLHLLSMLSPSLKHPISNKVLASMVADVPFIKSMALNPAMVGIVNITSDSFSDGGLYMEADMAAEQAWKLLSYGAGVIELGAQSTRPGAKMMTPELEYDRLHMVLERLGNNGLTISIDSFVPQVICKVLDNFQISWVNDVSGALDDDTLKIIAKHGCKIVTMHSISIPPQKDNIMPIAEDVVDGVNRWAVAALERMLRLGFKLEDVILDPGIGFGKSSYQNISLLRHIKQLKRLGAQVLVGHSRKSYMNSFSQLNANERDLETIANSSALHQAGVDFIRVHNIMDHQRFFVAQQSVIGGVDV